MLHPVRVLDRVIEEYRDYLLTEFRAKDPALKDALERELDRPRFLAQEPFFQAHRPFRAGRRWRELPIDARLAGVMERRAGSDRAWRHQSDAIELLRGAAPAPLVVTTGTGSGKTEAFLLPVIQNAMEDASRFKHAGLTALLVYPMNALANDQELRIEDYLGAAGFSGAVTVARYDRGTSEEDRQRLRRSPPHVLLTNYMMLEYLLVRPTDRENIFANHRCRFLVLDEVHTYRGTLGSNIALLVRRVRAHLARARQDWSANPPADQAARFPILVPVGTSATIKSVTDDPAERDAGVREFFSKLTGVEAASVRVLGEELEEIAVPPEAVYPPTATVPATIDPSDPEAVRLAMAALAGAPTATPLAEAARRCRLLWDLNRWLIRTPMSVPGIASRAAAETAARAAASETARHAEITAALVAGAALVEGTPGALRLRAHRLIRGGWQFHRCVDPGCGRLYPMGEERCACGHATAPLYLCRNCGADYLRFVGDPDSEPLRPAAVGATGSEWMLYDHRRLEAVVDDELEPEEENGAAAPTPVRGQARQPTQMRRRPVLRGSFDPGTLSFSQKDTDYSLAVTLAPARTQCLCCGGSAGSRNVITPVALGTSAAVKVVSEGLVEALALANRGRAGHDGKERLLVFSDSRQDAAHQARFVIFASRYDRMRRLVVRILDREGPLPLQRLVELLGAEGIVRRDNPHAPSDPGAWMSEEAQMRLRAWEEAPLLDEISVSASYRATLVNLGLVGVAYDRLGEYVRARGGEIGQRLGVDFDAIEYICRCLLDEMRTRGCLSRLMLRYHPRNPTCPAWTAAAEWERRVKNAKGYAASSAGAPVAHLDSATIPSGITANNAWRRPRTGAEGRAWSAS